MKKFTLAAQPRTVTGRKTKNLRKSGILPGTVYGKKVKSVSVQVKSDEFAGVYKDAGETGVVELKLEKEVRPTLIHNVQLDPVSDTPLHIEFFQVDLKEKVKTKVPVEIVGESPVVVQKQGVLLTLLSEIEVEALPTDLPEKITADVSVLTSVDQELKVNNLTIPSGVTVLTEGGVSVAKVGSLVTKEAEAEAKAAQEAAAQAAAAAAPTEAAPAPTEGAPKPAETGSTPTEKPQEEKKN